MSIHIDLNEWGVIRTIESSPSNGHIMPDARLDFLLGVHLNRGVALALYNKGQRIPIEHPQ